MPLDPIVKALIDQAAALNMPNFQSLSPQQAREMYKATRSTAAPEPVDRSDDRTIPGPAGDIPVRVYAPANDGPLPALVYYHGGGWVIGDLDTHDGICRMLANRARCCVVSVDYRLAPEHKYPAAVDDSYAAAAYVQTHADEFGIDAARVAVGGDSAGGNLAAAVCLMARDLGGPPLVFQLLVYPVTDQSRTQKSYVDNATGYFLETDTMRWFSGHYLRTDADAQEAYAAPLLAKDVAAVPPALIITAEFDPLRDEGEQYGERLRAAGIPAAVSRYDGQVHGFLHMTELVPRAREAIDESAAALRDAFARTPAPA
jgi:acetyl esterase